MLKLLKGAGRLSGVLSKREDGAPVRGLKSRRAVLVLVVALLGWAGLPPDVAQALADFLYELATEYAP